MSVAHSVRAIEYLGKLATLNWRDMGMEPASLVMLAMGLALRDVYAAHIREDGKADPEDMPSWVSGSPLKVEQIQKVMEKWATQLGPVEYEDEDEEGGRRKTRGSEKRKESGKGKGKEKEKEKESDGQSDDAGEDKRPWV
jgi:hypothetical protein